RIAQFREHRRARRVQPYVAGELHTDVTGAPRAPVFRSGERYGTRTTNPGGAAQRRRKGFVNRRRNSRASIGQGQKSSRRSSVVRWHMRGRIKQRLHLPLGLSRFLTKMVLKYPLFGEVPGTD